MALQTQDAYLSDLLKEGADALGSIDFERLSLSGEDRAVLLRNIMLAAAVIAKVRVVIDSRNKKFKRAAGIRQLQRTIPVSRGAQHSAVLGAVADMVLDEIYGEED